MKCFVMQFDPTSRYSLPLQCNFVYAAYMAFSFVTFFLTLLVIFFIILCMVVRFVCYCLCKLCIFVLMLRIVIVMYVPF
jgi:hypothetical protein